MSENTQLTVQVPEHNASQATHDTTQTVQAGSAASSNSSMTREIWPMLPAEIRDMILLERLSSSVPISLNLHEVMVRQRLWPLFGLRNRHLQETAEKIYYEHNTFVITHYGNSYQSPPVTKAQCQQLVPSRKHDYDLRYPKPRIARLIRYVDVRIKVAELPTAEKMVLSKHSDTVFVKNQWLFLFACADPQHRHRGLLGGPFLPKAGGMSESEFAEHIDHVWHNATAWQDILTNLKVLNIIIEWEHWSIHSGWCLRHQISDMKKLLPLLNTRFRAENLKITWVDKNQFRCCRCGCGEEAKHLLQEKLKGTKSGQ